MAVSVLSIRPAGLRILSSRATKMVRSRERRRSTGVIVDASGLASGAFEDLKVAITQLFCPSRSSFFCCEDFVSGKYSLIVCLVVINSKANVLG